MFYTQNGGKIMTGLVNQNEKNQSKKASFYAKLYEYKISKKYRFSLKNIAFISEAGINNQHLKLYLNDEISLKKENNALNKSNKEIIKLL